MDIRQGGGSYAWRSIDRLGETLPKSMRDDATPRPRD